MQQVTDRQRRARLARRHALVDRVPTVEAAVEAMTCLHATEPATPFLSVLARTDLALADVERALYVDRSVVRQLAMRRTLFVFPRDLLPAVWGSASARVAVQQRATLTKDARTHGWDDDPEAWVERTTTAVRAELAHGPATTVELRERVPGLDARLSSPTGTVPVAPRVLGVLAADGSVQRGLSTVANWRVSRPRWTLVEDWLGEPVVRLPPEEGYAALVGRWLHTFGPGTETDLVWWLGGTKGVVRAALATLGAVAVGLEGGATGWLLPDDLEDVPEPAPWAALLPVLDPTVMGWKERAFHLDPDLAPLVFDRNGNAGTTAWWDGRVVGCWVQDADGVVEVVLHGDPGADAVATLDRQAQRLTALLDGQRVGTVYPSPLMRSAQKG